MKIWCLCLALALACGGCKKSATAPKDESTKLAKDTSPVMLTVKWPVGNRYTERMEMNGDTETTMPQMPKPMQQKVQVIQEYSITVLGERPKGGRELELEFESTEIDVTMNGKPVLNLDTQGEAGGGEVSNPIASSFRQVIGARIKFLLDASNHVEKVEGYKEFVAKATAGGNPQSRAIMQNMFSEDYFQQMVDFARGLPRQPVNVGESWPLQTDLNVPVLGVMKMDLTYTFKGWEPREKRRCAAIDFTGTMTSKSSSNAAPMGMTSKVESGQISGKTWFDPELGNPVETLINQDLVIHMTVPAPRAQRTNVASQAAASQNLTNRSKQKIVIKLADVVSAAK